MKSLKMTFQLLTVLFLTLSAHAQAFHDLNFEQANPVIDPAGEYYPNDVTAASALPGWTVLLGNVQQTDVLQNLYTLNQASVDIFGPNYPAASGGSPGIIDGNYTVMLQAGNLPPNVPLTDVNASIAQSGLISSLAKSIEFKVDLVAPTTAFAVSFDGNNLTPVELGTGPNYTLYGVDISPYAGQVGTLEFSALYTDGRPSEFELDDIQQSGTVVPEPSPFLLTGLGGLIFSLRRRFRLRPLLAGA